MTVGRILAVEDCLHFLEVGLLHTVAIGFPLAGGFFSHVVGQHVERLAGGIGEHQRLAGLFKIVEVIEGFGHRVAGDSTP